MCVSRIRFLNLGMAFGLFVGSGCASHVEQGTSNAGVITGGGGCGKCGGPVRAARRVAGLRREARAAAIGGTLKDLLRRSVLPGYVLANGHVRRQQHRPGAVSTGPRPNCQQRLGSALVPRGAQWSHCVRTLRLEIGNELGRPRHHTAPSRAL